MSASSYGAQPYIPRPQYRNASSSTYFKACGNGFGRSCLFRSPGLLSPHGMGGRVLLQRRRDPPRIRQNRFIVRASRQWQEALAGLEKVVMGLKAYCSALLLHLSRRLSLPSAWWARSLAVGALLLGLLTAAINVGALRSVNRRLLPMATSAAAHALEREVKVGRVHWVAPSGLVGATPLAAVGPVSVGPGPAERSSVSLPRVLVCVDPLQSLLQKKLVLTFRANHAQVSLVQGHNFSWFGFPDDTSPLSSRDFVPGITPPEVKQKAQEAAALVGSKLMKGAKAAERLKVMPPAPDAAVNFRVAVGSNLHLVTKDDRAIAEGLLDEATGGRLSARDLLTQQSQDSRAVPPGTSAEPPGVDGVGTRSGDLPALSQELGAPEREVLHREGEGRPPAGQATNRGDIRGTLFEVPQSGDEREPSSAAAAAAGGTMPQVPDKRASGGTRGGSSPFASITGSGHAGLGPGAVPRNPNPKLVDVPAADTLPAFGEKSGAVQNKAGLPDVAPSGPGLEALGDEAASPPGSTAAPGVASVPDLATPGQAKNARPWEGRLPGLETRRNHARVASLGPGRLGPGDAGAAETSAAGSGTPSLGTGPVLALSPGLALPDEATKRGALRVGPEVDCGMRVLGTMARGEGLQFPVEPLRAPDSLSARPAGPLAGESLAGAEKEGARAGDDRCEVDSALGGVVQDPNRFARRLHASHLSDITTAGDAIPVPLGHYNRSRAAPDASANQGVCAPRAALPDSAPSVQAQPSSTLNAGGRPYKARASGAGAPGAAEGGPRTGDASKRRAAFEVAMALDDERRASGAAASTSASVVPHRVWGLAGGAGAPQPARHDVEREAHIQQPHPKSRTARNYGPQADAGGPAPAVGTPEKRGGTPRGTRGARPRRNLRSRLRRGMSVLTDMWAHVGSQPSASSSSPMQSGTTVVQQSPLGTPAAAHLSSSDRHGVSGETGPCGVTDVTGAGLGVEACVSGHTTEAHGEGSCGAGLPHQATSPGEGLLVEGQAAGGNTRPGAESDVGENLDAPFDECSETNSAGHTAEDSAGSGPDGGPGVPGRPGDRPRRVLFLRGWPPEELVDVAGPRSPFLIRLRDIAKSHHLPWPLDAPPASPTPSAAPHDQPVGPASGTEGFEVSSLTIPPPAPSSAVVKGTEGLPPQAPVGERKTEGARGAENAGSALDFTLEKPNLTTSLLQLMGLEAKKQGGAQRQPERVVAPAGQADNSRARTAGFDSVKSLGMNGKAETKGVTKRDPSRDHARRLWELATERALVLKKTGFADAKKAASEKKNAFVQDAGLEPAPAAADVPSPPSGALAPGLPEEATPLADAGAEPQTLEAIEDGHLVSDPDPEDSALVAASNDREASLVSADTPFAQEAKEDTAAEGKAGGTSETGKAAELNDVDEAHALESHIATESEVREDGSSAGETSGVTPADAAGGVLETGRDVTETEVEETPKKSEVDNNGAGGDLIPRRITPPFPDPAVMCEPSSLVPPQEVIQRTIRDSRPMGGDPVMGVEKEDKPTASKSGKPKRSHTSPSIKARYGAAEQDAVEPRYKPAPAEQVARPFTALLRWLERKLVPVVQRLQPEVAVEALSIRHGELKAYFVGEPIPRVINDVDLRLRLGPNYQTLKLDIFGNAQMRDAASNKCTMPSPQANRTLRDMKFAPIVRSVHEAAPPVLDRSQLAYPPALPQPGSPPPAAAFRLGVRPEQWKRQLEALMGSFLADEAELPDQATSPKKQQRAPGEAGGGPLVLIEDAQYGRTWWGGRRLLSDARPDKAPGGRVHVRVTAKHINEADRWPDLNIVVYGKRIHAPMLERILEIPIDIYDGRMDGEFRMRAYDAATWKFPTFGGRVRCTGMAMHFWDATDDFSDVNMDLVLEGERLYFHDATGYFGAIPMVLTGDMDINPDTGSYRISASIPRVELNELRKTLAIRPPPFPVGGAVRGVLHCTGPLEQPVFSGTAVAMPPSPAEVEGMEDSNAKETLQDCPEAAGVYDKVPFAAASAIFTMDTSTDIFLLHSFQAQPLGGGSLLGSGRVWVAPEAEFDPRAIRMQMRGNGLPSEAILKRYLPKGAVLPASLVLGEGNVRGTMEGSIMDGHVRTTWDAPTAGAAGTAEFCRDATRFTCKAPTLEVSGVLHMTPPSFEAVRAAVTQAEATALAVPNLRGADLDCSLMGLDVMPAVNTVGTPQPQPARLKLTGRATFSGQLGSGTDGQPVFSGDLSLNGMRANQLKLSRSLSGRLEISERGLEIRAKGRRMDEALDVALPLPISALNPSAAAARAHDTTRLTVPEGPRAPAPGHVHGKPAAPRVPPRSRGKAGSQLSLRCGQLLVSAEVNDGASVLDCTVQGLKLDELEMASLRGELQEASLHLNLDTRLGRGQVAMVGPRFSGLRGESMSAAFRWERDVVRLERAVLQQRNSRYEVQGEYTLPANAVIPRSASQALSSAGARDFVGAGSPASQGRWRLQVSVPTADIEEILPAARLLSRATALTPVDYERAKTLFLEHLESSQITALDLAQQLEAAALRDSPPVQDEEGGEESKATSRTATSRSGNGPLPGLQDMKGRWSGAVQAYGGGGGATNVDFNLRGQDWGWGAYCIDQVVAVGSSHSDEGLHLEEVTLKTGEAKLAMQGSLLGARQDASLLVTDFPVALLRPLFRSLPALDHVPPALPPGGGGTAMTSSSFGVSFGRNHLASDNLTSSSPIRGQLFISGHIGGSAAVPEGELKVGLYDAAIGTTTLAQAQAKAALDKAQRLQFNVDLVPMETRSPGHVRISGVLPLKPADSPGGGDSMEVGVSVKDSGMRVITALVPDVRWQSGTADVALRIHGPLSKPAVSGSAHCARASVACPAVLKFPMTGLGANIRFADHAVMVDSFEARVGKKGHIRIKGGLPIAANPSATAVGTPAKVDGPTEKAGDNSASSVRPPARPGSLIGIEMEGLDLRVRNVYTGMLDASIKLRNSLLAPVVGGDLRFSRGVASMIPPATSGGSSSTAASVGASEVGAGDRKRSDSDLLRRAFTVLTNSTDSRLARQLARLDTLRTEGSEDSLPAVENVMLKGVKIHLGPELRAIYPVVVNLGISGDVEVCGPANPNLLRLNGTINLDGGEINLVATQLVVEREQPNRLVFSPEQGLNPFVELNLKGMELRAHLACRASDWQKHLQITPIKAGSGEAAEQLDAAEVARIFEGQLESALLAEDGQLALSNLAASAAHGFMPRIQTQGQLGQARWRLVSAPSIPGLLSLDPSGDPSSLLSSLTMGTEVEVQFGKSLQAAMARKLRESDIATQWTLNYQINSKVRMQFNISSMSPYPRTLVFQYSSESPPVPNS